MSLVAYGSSDESTDEEDIPTDKKVSESSVQSVKPTSSSSTVTHDQHSLFTENNSSTIDIVSNIKSPRNLQFGSLPKPEKIESGLIAQDLTFGNPAKKSRVPVKITVPSLAEFADVEEENETEKTIIKPSEKGTGLFAVLPPLRGIKARTSQSLLPHVLAKKSVDKIPLKSQALDTKTRNPNVIDVDVTMRQARYHVDARESTSEDDGDSNVRVTEKNENTDFFSLSEIDTIPDNDKLSVINIDSLSKDNGMLVGNGNKSTESKSIDGTRNDPACNYNAAYNTENLTEIIQDKNSDKILVSNVMNLPKEEIILKNKAEVGPKLPVPEQDYNVDSKGNVAFDEKAIEYLCGKRGVKRKDMEIDEANIIEINGEDIKPDEREWLIKAMTEEAASRPISMQSAGPSTQSKKKHQITYLAHQAKAMEIELKNQWAQNRMTRKQTQSKYGF